MQRHYLDMFTCCATHTSAFIFGICCHGPLTYCSLPDSHDHAANRTQSEVMKNPITVILLHLYSYALLTPEYLCENASFGLAWC